MGAVSAPGLHIWTEKSIPLTYAAGLHTCSLSDGTFSGEVPGMEATEDLPLTSSLPVIFLDKKAEL